MVHGVPTGAVYSVLLVAHVVCAVVGFGAMVVTGVQARRARRGPDGPGAEGVRRYFRPGVNWAGRALYGVPVFGVGLLGGQPGGLQRSATPFVVVGLVVWVAGRRGRRGGGVARGATDPGRADRAAGTRRRPTAGSIATAGRWRWPPRCSA